MIAIFHLQSSILAQKWRNAVGLRHLPEGTHSLATRPGTLVRLTFQNWFAEPKLDRTKAGLPRRILGEGWSAWQDLHLQPFRFERNASSILGYTRLVPTAGFAPALCAF